MIFFGKILDKFKLEMGNICVDSDRQKLPKRPKRPKRPKQQSENDWQKDLQNEFRTNGFYVWNY